VTGLLFDLQPITPMQKGAGSAGRPVDAGDAHLRSRASTDHAVIPPPQEVSGERQGIGATDADGVRRARGSEIPLSPDVLRRIEHKRGPFRWLVDTDPNHPREHYVVQLRDGSYLVEMIDNGERVPLNWPEDTIEANLRKGIWREVEG
jgi:hypothetical protein